MKNDAVRSVLVIDDEKATLKMFALFLEAYGYQVHLAENGSIGLEVALRERPGIVFTDIKMPGLDGIEVLRQIKAIDSAIEVIVMTGHGDMDLAVQALNLDATDFISKPIQRTALEAALSRAEERLRLSRHPAEHVRLEDNDGVKTIVICGVVTSRSEAKMVQIYNQAAAQGSEGVLIHFDEAASLNGAAIGILVQLLSRSQQRRQKVAITGISANFRQIFKMVGITRYARIFDSKPSATTYLKQR